MISLIPGKTMARQRSCSRLRIIESVASLLSASLLVACGLDTTGLGLGSAGLAEQDTGTTSGLPGTSADTTRGGDDPGPTTVPLDSTDPGDTSNGSGDPDATATAGSTTAGSDTTTGDQSTTGVEGCVLDTECPPHWVCMSPDCINPDEGQPCGNPGECGPAAPLCGPDGQCHDGSADDPCSGEEHCAAPLLCGPSNTCQDGDEGDACAGPEDCGATAPICAPDDQCHDGSDGDPCSGDEECAGMLLCGPANTCQDGSEGDPCAGPEDCGDSAPHCPSDDQCHDGSFGDPCDDDSQCEGFFSFCDQVVTNTCVF